MKNPRRVLAKLFVTFLAAPLAASTAARAQWSTDPGVNLAVADHAGTETIPLVASTPDGGTYVAWFDGTGGSFQVRLQRLNAVGVEQWAHDGILISDHPQNSALFGWDMIADSSGNAVLVFSDERGGGDLDIYAYRISPTRQFLWGPDGVTLSNNPDFEPAPRVVEASDGDFVFVWQRDPSSGDGDIRMQRLSPAGAVRLAPGGVPIVASLNEDPGFVIMAPTDNGSVIVAWLRNIRSFSSPRHLRARKFSATGTPVWVSHVVVYDQFSLPIGYFPEIRPDGAGGAVLVWHRSDGSFFNGFVQHLDAAGVELFPHEGVPVSTTGGTHHISPSPAYDPATGSTYVFWNERNSLQSQWGIYAQKITAAGARAWGDGGLTLMPVDSVFKSLPRAAPDAGEALAVLPYQPSGTDTLVAWRLDASGTSVWGPSPVVLSNAASGKARYPVSIDGYGTLKVAWEDDRNGSTDVYAQNVLRGGALGPSSLPGSIGTSLRVAKSTTTPGDLVLSWGASCAPGAANGGIYEGVMGSFASHVMRDCNDDDGDRTETLTPGAGDRYYLLVVEGPAAEGSYGRSSAGTERPAPVARCQAAQNLAPCP